MFGILCFGDSITFGRGDPINRGWVGRLREYFELKDYYNAVYNLGIPGDTSHDVLDRFEVESKTRTNVYWPSDRFVIMISVGTNDTRGDKEESYAIVPEEFKENIKLLINKAKKYTKDIVLVGLLPVDEKITSPWENYYYTNKKQEEFNNIVKKCCEEHKVKFVDMFSKWIDSSYQELLDDGLHPNAQGYEKMYQQIKEFLIKNKIIE